MRHPIKNISTSGTLIALDIAKKHHDAKFKYSNGRTTYLISSPNQRQAKSEIRAFLQTSDKFLRSLVI